MYDPATRPLKDPTKLVSFVIDGIDRPPRLDVNVKSVVKIVFTDTDGLCDGDNVFVVMRDSVRVVTSVVDDFERLFF